MVLRPSWSFTHLVYICYTIHPPSPLPLEHIYKVKIYHKTKTIILTQTNPDWKATLCHSILNNTTVRRMYKTKWMQKATVYHGNPPGLSHSRKFLLPLLKVPTFVETVKLIYCQVEHQTSWNGDIGLAQIYHLHDSLNTAGASQYCWCF